MEISDINLSGFIGRPEALKRINRYHIYSPMFYRPSDYFHSIKVFFLVKAVIPVVKQVFGDRFDGDKAVIMGLVHDDAEIITGDIQSGQKAKMTSGQLAQIDNNERRAIDRLSAKFPSTINGYSYAQLLIEVMKKNTLESQVVKYLDHVDALGEAYHELYAGNQTFITHVIDPKLGKIDLPHEFYINRFNASSSKYPLLEPLLSNEPPFLKYYISPDISSVISNGKPHTVESLKKDTGNIIYDWWKNTLLDKLEPEELQDLYIQKEFI